MVHRELKQVVVRREPEEPGPEDRPLREIERSPSLLDQQGLYRGETLVLGTKIDIENWQPKRRMRRNGLARLPVHRHEGHPQRLVTLEQLAEAVLERRHHERSAYPDGARDVVGGPARLEAIDEPQAFLRERQGLGTMDGRLGGSIARGIAGRMKPREKLGLALGELVPQFSGERILGCPAPKQVAVVDR